jgi:hypothetical protein
MGKKASAFTFFAGKHERPAGRHRNLKKQV